MDIQEMINTLKEHPDSGKIGMIATHLGVVRGTSREGGEVTEIQVGYNYNVIADILNDIKSMPGIIEVLVNATEGRLQVGDEILAVAVAGDIRENVFAALMKAVNRIKTEASKNEEYMK